MSDVRGDDHLPFHPLVGQSVLVVDKKHGGTRYLSICKPGEGARLLLPEWMTFPKQVRFKPYPVRAFP